MAAAKRATFRDSTPTRLDRAVAQIFDGVSRTLARKLIASGSVFINGKRCKVSSRLVHDGDRLELGTIDPTPGLRHGTSIVNILCLHDAFVCVDKPAGMPTSPTRESGAGTALEVVRGQLRSEGGSGELYVVHRLDAGTSGALLFARTRSAAAKFGDLFEAGEVSKTYRALVDSSTIAEQGTAIEALATRGGRAYVDNAGRAAVTHWRVLERRRDASLLELRPETGRLHQIRVHMAAADAPIVGDPLYGGATAPRLHLHAYSLSFEFGGRTYSVTATESMDFPGPD